MGLLTDACFQQALLIYKAYLLTTVNYSPLLHYHKVYLYTFKPTSTLCSPLTPSLLVGVEVRDRGVRVRVNAFFCGG